MKAQLTFNGQSVDVELTLEQLKQMFTESELKLALFEIDE